MGLSHALDKIQVLLKWSFSDASGEAASRTKLTPCFFVQLETTQKSEGKILTPGNPKTPTEQDFMQKVLIEDRLLRRDGEACIGVRD